MPPGEQPPQTPNAPVTRTVQGELIEYVLQTRGPDLVVQFHGAHMRADFELGIEAFADAGWSELRPSRPGYGLTPLSAGPDPTGFVDRIATLCRELGYARVCAVGVSAGAREAIVLAVRHPELARGLILEGPTSFAPWPDPVRRWISRFLFAPWFEPVTWWFGRLGYRLAPPLALRAMMSQLSTLPVGRVYRGLSAAERRRFLDLFARMRSGRGVRNDIRPMADPSAAVGQPTLIVASRNDGALGDAHRERLARVIPHARVVLTDALSHFVWIGPDSEAERAAVREFLAGL